MNKKEQRDLEINSPLDMLSLKDHNQIQMEMGPTDNSVYKSDTGRSLSYLIEITHVTAPSFKESWEICFLFCVVTRSDENQESYH